MSGLILGLHPANERQRYKVTMSLIGWVQAKNQPCWLSMVHKIHITYTYNMLTSVGIIWIHHNDVIKWKHFPRYWPFVRGIHQSPVNSPHKGQWRRALMFSLICVWINGWVNNPEAGDLRRYRAHYDVTVMSWFFKNNQLTAAHWCHITSWKLVNIGLGYGLLCDDTKRLPESIFN